MRLLDTRTGAFREVSSSNDVPYAILSHVWDLAGEQSYQDIRIIQESFTPKKSLVRRLVSL